MVGGLLAADGKKDAEKFFLSIIIDIVLFLSSNIL